MNQTAIRLALIGCFGPLTLGAHPAFADVTDDLKAEIAAQRAQLDAQRARLEALEKKLDATAAAQQETAKQAAASSSMPSSLATGGKGLTLANGPSSITLYGLIDGTISTIDHANAKGDRVTSYQTAWFSGDRWGITGKHDLNKDGLKAIFKLESEYEMATGNEDTPGVLFNRDAWIGFESDALGKITFGRQNALARDFAAIYLDPYGSAKTSTDEGGGTNVNNFKQLIFYAASVTGTRYDRGVVWKKKFGDNFYAGVGYQFGGVAGDFSKGSTQTLALGYNSAPINLAGYYNHLDVNGLKHSAWSIGGNVPLGPVRINAGYFNYTAEQGGGFGDRKDKAYTLSAKFAPGGPMDYELGYQIIKAENAGINASGFVLTPYADANGIKGVATGDKKTLYGSVFYHFDQQTEVYFAADYMKLTNGYKLSVTNGYSDQTEVAVGMRFRF
jgi:predicted porin